MKRFVEGEDRRQATLLPDSLEDYVTEDNPVRVVNVFIGELDLEALRFSSVVPKVAGQPAYPPATLLKIYLYGYLNRIQSSRRLERETQRNIELMWLTPSSPNAERARSRSMTLRSSSSRSNSRRWRSTASRSSSGKTW
jgi:transposase